MNKADAQKFLDVLNENVELKQKLENCDRIDDLVNVFAEYGISVTVSELEEAISRIKNVKDELDENELEKVSGGRISWRGFKDFVKDLLDYLWGVANGIYDGAK